MTDPTADLTIDARELAILHLAEHALEPVVHWAIQASLDALHVGAHAGHEHYLQYLAGGLLGMQARIKLALCPIIEFTWKLSPAACEIAASCHADLLVDEFKRDWTVPPGALVGPFRRRLLALEGRLPLMWALKIVLALRKGRATEAESAVPASEIESEKLEGESDAVPE